MKSTCEISGGADLYKDFVVADFAGEVAELHLELVRGPVLVPDESQLVDFNKSQFVDFDEIDLLTLSASPSRYW